TRCTGASSCGFDPVLESGMKGIPGIHVRFNPHVFRYASQLVGDALSREIQHARLPDIIQSTQPLFDGQFVLYDAYVARYRCSQRVVIITKSPNRIVLQLQNFDVGINANVGGHVSMMMPMVENTLVPSRNIKIDARGLILNVEVEVEKVADWPHIAIVSCGNFIDQVEISLDEKDEDTSAQSTLNQLKVSLTI
ncbi:hypothetical protein PMAYCL1PPCAC_17232, partial [Pristionchus mayeri]